MTPCLWPCSLVAGGSWPPAAPHGVTVHTTALCRAADMRTLFVLLLSVVGVGLAYFIALGLLHR